MRTHASRTAIACAAGLALVACGDDITRVTEITGTTLVTSVDEPAGDNCADGGTAVLAGTDLNANGVLDDSEVASTTYFCDGTTAAVGTTLLTADEPAGDNCPDGGTSITTGVDADGDGALTGDEITDVRYVCAASSAGGDALTVATEEPAGDNCPNGGMRLDAGTDDDGSGSLDEGEITATSYACYPADEGAGDLMRDEAFIGDASASCKNGYVANYIGFDADGSGTLDEAERELTLTWCNASPGLEGANRVAVDDCTVDFTFDVGAVDVDGTIETIEIDLLGSGAEFEPTYDGGEITILGGDANAGGAYFTVTVTDNYGATHTDSFTVEFTGTGCLPPASFYGVDPDSCTEIEINPEAGDDRGSVVLSASYVFYNGDQGLVRTDRALDGLERVVAERIDTLFSDGTTFDLYTLWSSDYAHASLADVGRDLQDNAGPFDQIVPVDETSLEIGDPISLEVPISGRAGVAFTSGDTDFNVSVDRTLIGASDGHLVAAMEGYDAVSDGDVVVYVVYDLTDGSVLSTWWIDADDPAFRDYSWWSQEVELGHNPVRFDGEAEYLLYRSSDGWSEVNVRTGDVVRVSQTYALDCDSYHPAIDFASLTLVAHSEGRCFDEEDRSETLFVCDLLRAPNYEGGVDDSGVSDWGRD